MQIIKEIFFFTDINNKCFIKEWLDSLDIQVRNRILLRLSRLEYGNLGDYKLIGDGIYELRFFFGKGYRIYYIEENNKIVLLLNGGDKDSQAADIKKAKRLLKEYERGRYEKIK